MTTDWREVRHEYAEADREAYIHGDRLEQWRQEHEGTRLFCGLFLGRNKQAPPMFFSELFVGIKYLEAGYDVLWAYQQMECPPCFGQARKYLGGSNPDRFLKNEKHGRPPDLLVFDKPTGRIRFVECKLKAESLTERQKTLFPELEAYLNTVTDHRGLLTDDRYPDLFPPLPTGQWIHIARTFPA